jgi:FkbM family methyltransferase
MRRRIPVLKRLIPSIRKCVARATWRGGFALVRSRTACLLVNYRNYVDRQIAFYDDYEAEQIKYLLARIRYYTCTAFIDIGANIGFYCVHVALETSVSHLSAFEPDPRNFDQLRANLFLNKLSTRVETHRVAISDSAGKVVFEAFPDTSTGQSRVSEGGGNQVEAVRLDDVLAFKGAKLAIKIDIEGHEIVAVDGMLGLLAANHCLIQAEVYPLHLDGFSVRLASLGYREVHVIDHDHYFTNFPPD